MIFSPIVLTPVLGQINADGNLSVNWLFGLFTIGFSYLIVHLYVSMRTDIKETKSDVKEIKDYMMGDLKDRLHEQDMEIAIIKSAVKKNRP